MGAVSGPADHDFVGREALERMAGDEHRHKLTLALDDDVTRTIGTMFGKAPRAKFVDWPSAVDSMHPFEADGRAARAGRAARDRQPRAVRRGGARLLRARRLAGGGTGLPGGRQAAASAGLPRIMSEAFSAIIIVGACVFERVIVGITEASTTRRPSIP